MQRKLTIFSPDFLAGGAQSVTVTLANGLQGRDHDVDLVAPFPLGRHAADVDPAVDVVYLRNDPVPQLGTAATLPHLGSYLARTKPDLVVAQRTHGNVVAIAASLLLRDRPPVLVTEHGHHVPDDRRESITNFLARRTYRFASGVVCVSESIAADVRTHVAVAPDRVHVVPNPFDLAAIREQAAEPLQHPWVEADGTTLVMTAGRLEPVKNIELLIEAFSAVHERDPSTRLLVLGKGSRREALVADARARGLSDVVEFPGYVDNPYSYMAAADVFVLPSHREALPSVLIEALAVGCPVVATDAGGASEILVDGEFGRLVPVDVDALATAISATLTDPADPAALRNRADRYSVETVLDAYEALFEETLARGR